MKFPDIPLFLSILILSSFTLAHNPTPCTFYHSNIKERVIRTVTFLEKGEISLAVSISSSYEWDGMQWSKPYLLKSKLDGILLTKKNGKEVFLENVVYTFTFDTTRPEFKSVIIKCKDLKLQKLLNEQKNVQKMLIALNDGINNIYANSLLLKELQ